MTGQTRTIAGLMSIVAVAAVSFAVLRIENAREFLLMVLACIIASPWVLGPVLLRKTHWVAVNSVLEPIEADDRSLPPEFSDTFRNARDGLAPLGFSLCGCFRSSELVPNAVGYLMVFHNERTFELHDIVMTFVGVACRMKISRVMIFQSEFEGDIEVASSNSRVLDFIPQIRGGIHVARLPGIEGLKQLYRIHQAWTDRIARGLVRRDLRAGGIREHLERDQQRFRAHQLASGYYRLDKTENKLRLTMMGACLAAWKQMWPVGPVRRVLRRIQARRLVRSLGLSHSLSNR